MYLVKITWYSGPIVDNWNDKYFSKKENAQAYYNALRKQYGANSMERTIYMLKIETSDHEIEELLSEISLEIDSESLEQYRLQG
jgi:hypothetical protein